jgi:hypothetical protein
MSRLRGSGVASVLLALIIAQPALAQRWSDPPAGEIEPAWAVGLVFGALAGSAARNAPGTLRGVSVGTGISAGVGLGISLGHRLSHHDGSPSIVWPVVGAAVTALPLTMASSCGKRRDPSCGWTVLIVPLLSTITAELAHVLSQH